ncbi:MAG: glycosyltransferase family 4 protein [Anaerolineae bacterium]|nr:glycosyltransferase family 4 protein [Anaerolineae bacterium]
MRIGIDYTSAARQRAGIGRYTRELVAALLAFVGQDGILPHKYVLFAATGGLPRAHWQREIDRLHAIRNSQFAIRNFPLSDEWLARLWHRARLPIPVEAITGPLDIFYSPDFVLPPTRRRTRTLLTVHDLSFLHYPEAFVPKLRRYLERVVPRSIARADLVLADSEATQADIISLLGVSPDKVQVLYSGVHPRFRPQPEPGEAERIRARYGLDQRPYVFSVGTVQPRKNYVRLIHAFNQLTTQLTNQPTNHPTNQPTNQLTNHPPTQLLIAGGRGWLYQDIFAEAEKYSDRVRILGFVDEADLPALYRHAALFAFPSLYEGFGLPVLEAMACGIPVVCSDVSSLPEVAGDAALLVDPLDTGALAQAMARVLEDADLCRGMIARGLAQATRFTWEQAARQLLGTFEGNT